MHSSDHDTESDPSPPQTHRTISTESMSLPSLCSFSYASPNLWLPTSEASTTKEEKKEEKSISFHTETDVKSNNLNSDPSRLFGIVTVSNPHIADNNNEEEDEHPGAIPIKSLGHHESSGLSERNVPSLMTETPLIISATLVGAVNNNHDDDENPSDDATEERLAQRVQQRIMRQIQPVNAIPVMNEFDNDNKPSSTNNQPSVWQNKKMRYILVGGALAIIVAVVVAVVLVVTRGETSLPHTPVPTPIPEPSSVPQKTESVRLVDFRTILSSNHISDAMTWNDSTTPQSRALHWLADVDNYLYPNDTQAAIVERYIMALLYYSTNGEQWIDQYKFLSPVDICQWYISNYGVVCDRGNRVNKMVIPQNNLNGTIPNEIGKLTKLTILSIFDNNLLGGTIPTEIGLLQNASIIDVSNNSLHGYIPTELWSLSSLELLHLFNNGLVGTLPTLIGGLDQLQVFIVSTNGLDGTIPSEIGFMTSLKALVLDGNKFSGQLPSEIGNLYQMVNFTAFQNYLNGTLPSEIGKWTNSYLFNIHTNALTGTLPTELGQLSGLYFFYVANNMLTGTVPTVLAGLPNLETLGLDTNCFYGNLTPFFCNRTHNITDFKADCQGAVDCSCCTYCHTGAECRKL